MPQNSQSGLTVTDYRRQLGVSRPGPKIPLLMVTEAQREVLQSQVRRSSTAQRWR